MGGDNIIENTFKGPIHQQLREALQFIKNSIVTKKIVKSADKTEADWVYNYPYAALEEALANAVYHRAYDIREPIEVRVEKEMIEIVSFPGPDRSVTKEGLKRYKVSNRRYRNRRIGDILKELHLTEGRNNGFGKILRALEENGSPKVFAICIRDMIPSCILAPPELVNSTTGSFSSVARSKALVIFSPTTYPLLPIRKRESQTPSTVSRPFTMHFPTVTAS